MIKIKNLFLVLKDQLPLRRMVINFIVKRNYGVFKKTSHYSSVSGKEKIKYNKKTTAINSAEKMKLKTGIHFSAYKCLYCNGFHIGK